MVFTMPSELKGLSTDNPSQLYNCLMRSAWASLKQGCLDKENLGALPGAIMVLHTFGSDLKYHVHVHALVSFGGVDEQGQWQWPNRKRKIVPFRQIRNDYRDDFLKRLKSIYPNLTTRQSYDKIYDVLSKKSWCVHCEPPTTNTKVIEEYLGRYICRIGLSKNRFHYDSVNREVSLSFKDYRNKDKSTGEVPKGIKKMNPLVAINQIMKHCLPAYFQKCRYYGLHASSCQRKYQNIIPKKIRNNNHTVRTIFQIIHAMLGIEEITCENCGHPKFDQWIILPDKQWMHSWLKVPIMNKGSPQKRSYNKNAASVLKRKGLLFAIHQVNHK